MLFSHYVWLELNTLSKQSKPIGKHSSRSARLILTCYGGIGSWLLFAPSGNKHSNGTVTPVQEEVDCEVDPPAREHFLVAVAAKKKKCNG